MVKNDVSYIERQWNSEGFRLITTYYKCDKVIVLHLLDENGKGMIKIYNKFLSKCKITIDMFIYKLCYLSTHDLLVCLLNKSKVHEQLKLIK